MDDKTLCPLCGEGHVTPRTENTVTEYRGQRGTVALQYAECDACGSEVVGDADSRANKRAVLRFRKSVDGLLTGDEIRAVRAKYKINQAQAAKLFGGGPVAFSKYENDDVAHSEAMDGLLRLVLQSEDAFWDLVAIKGISAELPARPMKKTTVTTQVIHFVVTIREELQAEPQFGQRFHYPMPKHELTVH